jgi:flagellar hook-associated protein 2
LYGDSNIASVDYTAKGVTIDVEATDSLNDIRDKIRSPENSQKYAEGNEIQATVVDRRLVLTSSQTGTSGKIKLFEVPEGVEGVLHELGIDVDGSGSLADPSVNELRAALDAEFSINNVDITRSRNKGLTDIVQGLSFDLTGKGETTVTVSDDNDAVADKTNDFLKAINDLRTYLKAKTEAVQGKDNESGNPTYTSAPLGQDYSIRLLRQDIGSLMLGGYDAAIGDAPKYLAEVGITLNTSGAFELSDNEKFSLALKNDFQGVQDLFADILGELENRLDMYNDGSKAILKSKQNALDDELKQVNSHIESTTKVLSRREDALRIQYMSVQSQLISMTYQFQSMQAISAGSMYSGQY